MTTYPGTGEPLAAGVLADGSTISHLAEHGGTLTMPINAKRYLKGDGTAEDPSQITLLQAASAGKHCYFPRGTYYWPDGVTFTTSSLSRYSAAFNALFSVKNAYAFTGTGVSPVVFDDIAATVRAGATSGGCIKMVGGAAPNLAKVYRSGGSSGAASATLASPLIWMQNCIGSHLMECSTGTAPIGVMWDAGTGGPSGNWNNGNSMSRCWIQGNSGVSVVTPSGSFAAGVYSEKGVQLAIRDCIVESQTSGYGVYCEAGNAAIFDNNWMEQNDLQDFYCNLTHKTKIVNNGFFGKAAGAVENVVLVGATGASNTIMGNNFQDGPSATKVTIAAGQAETNVVYNANLGILNVSDSGTRTVMELVDAGDGYRRTYHNGTVTASGTGSPEGLFDAPVGSIFQRSDGGSGTLIYVRETLGAAKTGWKAIASSGTSAYTVTNPTTDRALNVTGDTTAQVAQVLGTLIADLKTLKVIS